MNFFQVWMTGYYNPPKLIDELRSKPAPYWGIYAQLLRAVLDSLLIYLPVYLMGRYPPLQSYLSIIPTDRYYLGLVWLAPIILIVILLMQSIFIHVILRMLKRSSDIDQIINIIGMSALIVGAVLVPWDWAMYFLGVANQYFLGITHLVLSLWATVIMVIGLRKLFSVPIGLSIILSFTLFPVALPFAMMFMRSPF
jgi:hypothetical protein